MPANLRKSLRSIDPKISKLATLDHLEALLTFIEQNIKELVRNYDKKKSPQSKNKAIPFMRLIESSEEIKAKFKATVNRELIANIRFYATSQAIPEIRTYCQKLQKFLSQVDESLLQELRESLEVAKLALKQQDILIPQAPNANNSETHQNPLDLSSAVELPPAAQTMNLNTATSSSVKDNESLVHVQTIPHQIQSVAPEEIFHSPQPPNVQESSSDNSPIIQEEQQAVVLTATEPTAVDRLSILIEEIKKVIAKFQDGSKDFFSRKMGKKAEMIEMALVNAQKLIENESYKSISRRDLCQEFLNLKDENNKSLSEALNFQRLSFERKSGNSFFTNSRSSSLKNILNFIESNEQLNNNADQIKLQP